MSYGIIIRLETALERIAEISDVIAGKSRADLRQDRLFQLGLEQYLVRLGRTLAAVLTREPALAGTITRAPAVVETGETIIRDYATLDYDAIWDMTVHDLPLLKRQIQGVILTYIESPLPAKGRGVLIPMVDEKRNELIALCRQYCVSKLMVFGSAVNGTFDPERSDLDVAVDLGDAEPGVSKRFFHFIIALEDLFSRSVDVVTLHDGLSEAFRAELDRTAITIFESDQSVAGRVS